MSRSFAWAWVAAFVATAGVSVASCGGGGGDGGVDVSCDPGFHECAAECVRDDAPQNCGTSCTPCAEPAHGHATCSAGACGIACDPGHHACAGACFDDASPTHCGASCAACPAPAFAHAAAACIDGACGYTCDAGFARCDAGCCGGPAAGLARLAAGAGNTCGIDRAGALVCWGGNAQGAVGDGTTTSRLAPVAVAGAHVPRWVAVGSQHACAIDTAGKGWCWGDGWAGQLGDGITFGLGTIKPSPVAVEDLGAEAVMVAAGWSHSCALLANGTVKCWGNNEVGQLGDGTKRTNAHPVPVSGVSGAAAVLSGERFSCAVTGLAEMKCWGSNDAGQLGSVGVGVEATAPVAVTTLAGVTRLRAVALGAKHACVAYDGGQIAGGVRCWGAAPGNGRTEPSPTGVEVTGPLVPIDGVVALAAGKEHTCASTAAGGLLCWGSNSDGQLGDGTSTRRTTAGPVTGLASGVVGVAAGGRHSCALVEAAGGVTELRCWGFGELGQLGDGTGRTRTTPTLVPGF